ncbi:MAG: hypothetical protein ACFE9X_16205 [Promethearchaeota archaeon]
MLNKTKFNISVIVLAIGIGLVPTGFFLNGYYRDQVRSYVPETLLNIQETVIPEIESQFLGLGICEDLPIIQDQQTEYIEDEVVKILSIPSTLLYLKNLSMPLFLQRINGSMTSINISGSLDVVSNDINDKIYGSISAQLINSTIKQVMISNSTTEVFAREVFFNNYTFQDNYSTSILGVSEYATSGTNKLNYTITAQQRLLDGYLTSPGLTQDLENGTGVLDFMEFYNNATVDPLTYNQTMQTTYNSTWEQLTALAGYITNYLWNSIVPNIISANYSMTPSEYAAFQARELFFNDEHWSSTTKNITSIKGISEYGTGGVNNLSFSTAAQERILYGYLYAPGILEELDLGTGVLDFLDLYAQTSGDIIMQSLYDATFYQLKNVTSYLIKYMFEVIVTEQLGLDGLTLETAALRDFYSQWANASIFTRGIFLRDLSTELGNQLRMSTVAKLIRSNIIKIVNVNGTTLEFARNRFFNDFNLTGNFTVNIQGVSQFNSSSTYSLNYSISSQERILDGYNDAPGILESFDTGIGLLDWLDFYLLAFLDLGANRTLMETTYNATWVDHLFPMGQYLLNYMLGQKVGASTQKGLEIGFPTPSGISMSAAAILWDPANSSSFVNDVGIQKWSSAEKGNLTIQNELNITFGFSNTQFQKMYNWLFSTIKDVIVPIVFILLRPTGLRITTTEYAEILILEQWANATVIPAGLDLGGGVKGFEVGIPEKSNISLSTAIDFFDLKNSSSFIHKNGLLKWIDAENGDNITRTELITTFDLETDQFDLILNWLFTTFRNNVIPITFNITGYTLTEIAGLEFYRQWANGSLFTSGLDPGPAFGLPSLSGWELGIPTSSGIDLVMGMRLWDEENRNSLVSQSGIARWFNAIEDPQVYNYLINYFKFTDSQMQGMFEWLIKIREDFTLIYSKLQMGLPINAYEFGSLLILGFTVCGFVIAASGVLFAIITKLSKRRK